MLSVSVRVAGSEAVIGATGVGRAQLSYPRTLAHPTRGRGTGIEATYRGGTCVMPEFVVYRHGRDDVNQSADRGLPEKMAVARVTADYADEAYRIAAGRVTLAPHQHLTAEPAADVDAKEREMNRTARA